jgi:tRNA 5-methylaminomethyl-2-thiouridine biosynthesis bifunctional protein
MVRTASIRWQGQVPVSTAFDDPYFSLQDPVGEVQHTFIDGIDLASLSARKNLVIAETGFGTGLNFLLSANTWEKHAPASATLTYVSIEKYPLEQSDLQQALAGFDHLLPLATQLLGFWPGAIAGIHRLNFLAGRLRLLLLIGDVESMLQDQAFLADAWYLDGFAPARNPAMWSDEVFSEIARLSRPGARLASFTAAGSVRRGLTSAGFKVSRHPGFAQKRHCIRGERIKDTGAVTNDLPPWLRLPLPADFAVNQPDIAVIGAGIAGRCITRRLQQQNINATLIGGDFSDQYAGSRLPAALIAPRLVRGSDSYARFWAQAYIDAIRELDSIDDGDLWRGKRGLIFRFRGDDQSGLAGLCQSVNWPDSWMQWRSADEQGSTADALWFPRSGAIDPHRLFELLAVVPDINAEIKCLRRDAGSWLLIGEQNRQVCRADLVVIACGTGTSALLERPGGLRNGSGQLLQLVPPGKPERAVLHDGYLTAADRQGRVFAGSTINRQEVNQPIAISERASEEILERLSPYLGPINLHSESLKVEAWTGGRCDTTDHLPIVGPLQDHRQFDRDYAVLHQGKRASRLPDPSWQAGLFTLSGLGARGFQAAFLLADHLVSIVTGMPTPLSQSVTRDLLPSRFQIRDLKKHRSTS